MKRLLVGATVVCVLAGGSVAGAVVKDQIYVVKPGQEANLAGTKVSCIGLVRDVAPGKGQRSFQCAWYAGAGGYPKPHTYQAEIGDWGVEVEKANATGKSYDTVATYVNK